jgi:hypothetical protein
MNSQSTLRPTNAEAKVLVATANTRKQKVVAISSATETKLSPIKQTTKHELFLRICKKRSFVGFTFKEIGNKIENGKKKKDPKGYPESWGVIKKENYTDFINPMHKGFAIKTGAISGITVIDCDTTVVYDSIIRDYPQLGETLTVKTNKGFHMYCQYVKGAKNNEESFQSYPDVDIRNDGGIIFAPPTTYNFFGTHTGYKFVNKHATILPIPPGLIADLRDYSAP